MQAGSASETDQKAVIRFLSEAATYAPHASCVERIETHCSIIFLAGERAYKLKRAVRFASLDYTTRDRRQAACAAELALNRRTAPDLYLQVLSINCDRDGRLAFGGPGAAVDHVVVMRRFAQSDLFDRMVEAGRLTPALMQVLGCVVAGFHGAAERTPAFGGVESIRRVLDENERELGRVAPTLDSIPVGLLLARSRVALRHLIPLLEERRAGGSVRRCHGDLRLANICLYRGRPTLFDCIEFSDEISCIDTLYDLAFLLQDIWVLGSAGAANAAFNAYLDSFPETTGLRALPLFLALRAATRAYSVAGSASRRASTAERARLTRLAHRHIEAAFSFLDPAPPVLVAVAGGGHASGSQSLSVQLAPLVGPAPGSRVLGIGDRISHAQRAEIAALLAAGCSVVIQGAFEREEDLQTIAGVAARMHVPFDGLWLQEGLARGTPKHWHPVGISEPATQIAERMRKLHAPANIDLDQ